MANQIIDKALAFIGNTKMIRQVQTVNATVSSIASDTYTDVTISLSSYGFKSTPIVIPSSDGYLDTQVRSISATSVTLRAWNRTNGAHSGTVKAILIEFVGGGKTYSFIPRAMDSNHAYFVTLPEGGCA